MQTVCDLVLLSWNHLEETRPCLQSLFKRTQVPCRLFIVDNGSEPAVRAFLASVKPWGAIQEVTLLQNETNEGFPKGMNRGIQASSAPFICLLNNDLRFTTGWLQELIEVASAHPPVGLVNPTSSTFNNHPPKGMSLEAYATQLKQFHGRYVEVGMCIGFCLLVKRDVLNRIGGLSEEVERIFYEDEDFSERAQQAGYQCVVAQGAYVYHAEHQTVRKMPEREALFRRNQRWCEAKWGRRIRMAWPRFSPIVPGSQELRQWLERLVGWARRRTHVYVYCSMPQQLTCDELFRSVDLIPHADLHWYALPCVGAPAAAAALILSRRKKLFDVIAAPTSQWARWMEKLKWLHQAVVVPETNEEQLKSQWHQRSRSPSSS